MTTTAATLGSIETTDGRLYAVDDGTGPTVLFVHGTPSSSFEFRHVIAMLRDTTRCVAVDHLGFGRSDKPPAADYSLVAHQHRFATAMDALDVTDAVVVLHDFGTSIALPWMLDHPERVRGVVLANTFSWPVTGAMSWLLALYATAPGRWLYRVANLSARVLLPWAWGSHDPLTPEVHEGYLRPFAHARDRHATAALPGELIGQTLRDLEPRAAMLGRWPIRAVWGMADPLVGRPELARWRAMLPTLEVDEVPAAGHFVSDEAPDAIARAVRRLLEPT
jgi:haloalkane dehalogenase